MPRCPRRGLPGKVSVQLSRLGLRCAEPRPRSAHIIRTMNTHSIGRQVGLLRGMFGLVAALGAFSSAFAQQASSPASCHAGFYRLKNAGIDIAPSNGAALRWRMSDGTIGLLRSSAGDVWNSTLGWTDRADHHRVEFPSCDEVRFDGVAGRRVDFDVQDVRFESGSASLAGRLIMPKGKGPVPLIVLVHGSEQTSARATYSLQRQFPGEGVAAFVYDKRGTGESQGIYTHDYHVLAMDAAAALRAARRLAGPRAGRVGFQGSSQGGWVAPLAATLTPIDFVIVGYGLAVSPLDEDREAVELDMSRHGFGAAETRKALEVAAAAHAIVFSGFRSGYAELDAARAKYSAEPWFRFLRGNVTGILLPAPHESIRAQGPVLFAGIQPDYDPLPVLRRLDTPQLWILGAEDIDAPVGETLRRLRALRQSGRPIAAVVYPHAEHGMYEFETDAQGERVSLRQPASYLGLMCEFARRGRIGARYDAATIYR